LALALDSNAEARLDILEDVGTGFFVTKLLAFSLDPSGEGAELFDC
jgi:hypothetical protein